MSTLLCRVSSVIGAAFLLVSLAACDNPASVSEGQNETAPTAKYTIVTTCGMVTDIVREVVGDRAAVNGLMGEGVDPHLYHPTRSDVKQLQSADVVFYSGLDLEGKMTELFEKMKQNGKAVFAVTDGIDKAELRQLEGFEGHFDPHVWMDVELWGTATQFVADALAEYDSEGSADFQENARSYREKLSELHQYARDTIATIPDDQRVLITAHDAFGYFSLAYGIEIRSVQGLSTESAAGVDDINQLVDFIIRRKVKAIFVETSVSEESIEAIIEGTADDGWKLSVGGQLFSDAMGPRGTYEGTYIGMIDHNATVITRALGGNAPERGWQSKLTAK